MLSFTFIHKKKLKNVVRRTVSPALKCLKMKAKKVFIETHNIPCYSQNLKQNFTEYVNYFFLKYQVKGILISTYTFCSIVHFVSSISQKKKPF